MMTAVNPVDFILDKLSENWVTNDSSLVRPDFIPDFQAWWPQSGQVTPIVSCIMETTPIQTFGLPADHHLDKVNLRLTIWSINQSHKWIAERRIKKIIMADNKNPTTTQYADSGIDLLQITNKDDADDYSMDPVMFRRDIFLVAWIQESF